MPDVGKSKHKKKQGNKTEPGQIVSGEKKKLKNRTNKLPVAAATPER